MRKKTQVLRSALKLAKNGSIEEALALIGDLNRDSLTTEDLRVLALVHSYSGREHDAEQVWARICARDDVAVGDCFMFGTTQLALGHADAAIESLRRELATADAKGNPRYESASAINLAFLLSVRGAKEEALHVLSRLDEADGTHVHGVGQLTKRDLIARLKS